LGPSPRVRSCRTLWWSRPRIIPATRGGTDRTVSVLAMWVSSLWAWVVICVRFRWCGRSGVCLWGRWCMCRRGL
jgi:hypothetical protein